MRPTLRAFGLGVGGAGIDLERFHEDGVHRHVYSGGAGQHGKPSVGLPDEHAAFHAAGAPRRGGHHSDRHVAAWRQPSGAAAFAALVDAAAAIPTATAAGLPR